MRPSAGRPARPSPEQGRPPRLPPQSQPPAQHAPRCHETAVVSPGAGQQRQLEHLQLVERLQLLGARHTSGHSRWMHRQQLARRAAAQQPWELAAHLQACKSWKGACLRGHDGRPAELEPSRGRWTQDSACWQQVGRAAGIRWLTFLLARAACHACEAAGARRDPAGSRGAAQAARAHLARRAGCCTARALSSAWRRPLPAPASARAALLQRCCPLPHMRESPRCARGVARLGRPRMHEANLASVRHAAEGHPLGTTAQGGLQACPQGRQAKA